MLRLCLIALSLLFAVAVVPASAQEVKSCDDANVGIGEIIQPVATHSRSLSEDRVSIYAVDVVEPICCAAGVAIVMADPEDEVGGNKCLAVVGFASVDVAQATVDDDAGKGLRVSIPTRRFDGGDTAVPGDPLTLRIDVGKGTAVLE